MAVTTLSVAISCSRSAGSPDSLVTMPEVMIITEGFNPTHGTEIYEPRKKEGQRSRRDEERGKKTRERERERWGARKKETDRPHQKEKPKKSKGVWYREET